MILAQQQSLIETTSPQILEVITTAFSRVDTLAHPASLLQSLQSIPVFWACGFLFIGLICLFHGYRLYRFVTILLAFSVGVFWGYYLGEIIHAGYIVAGCLGILFASLCLPFMKYAVAILGGLVGAFMGANIWAGAAQLLQDPVHAQRMANDYWLGALAGLFFVGILAFILFKWSIMMFTSFCGAILILFGATSLLLQVPAWRQPVAIGLTAHSVILPLLVVVPTIVGIIMQQSQPTPESKPSTTKAPPAATS